MTSEIQNGPILRAVCRMYLPSGRANGFLCVSIRGFVGEEDLYLLATNNRVISDISIRSLTTYIFEFPFLPNLKQFQFADENIEFAWTDEKFDASVIEIKKGMAARMMQQGARFLEIGAPVFGRNASAVEDKEGISLFIVNVDILPIMSDGKIFYRSTLIPTSCGAPLVNKEGIAIGIHKGNNLFGLCEAVNLEFILQIYFQQRNNSLESARQGMLNDACPSTSANLTLEKLLIIQPT